MFYSLQLHPHIYTLSELIRELKPTVAWEMDSSNAQQQQRHRHEMAGSETLESMLVCTKAQQQEKKARPADAQAQKCPRCDSSNTKFCYYNNYSLSQPRYFCKSCRRYWTKGGTLRNVPVGGGCRRPNKRSSSSSTSSRRSHDHPTPGSIVPALANNPFSSPSSSSYDSNDLSLAFARLQKQGAAEDFSIWGNYNYPNVPPQDHFLGSLGLGTILDSQLAPMGGAGIQNMHYGNHHLLEMGSGGQETEIPHDGRVLWGFPWMQGGIGGGGGDGNVADMDSGGGRSLSWNGIGSSSNWQGLLNSPLM